MVNSAYRILVNPRIMLKAIDFLKFSVDLYVSKFFKNLLCLIDGSGLVPVDCQDLPVISYWSVVVLGGECDHLKTFILIFSYILNAERMYLSIISLWE